MSRGEGNSIWPFTSCLEAHTRLQKLNQSKIVQGATRANEVAFPFFHGNKISKNLQHGETRVFLPFHTQGHRESPQAGQHIPMMPIHVLTLLPPPMTTAHTNAPWCKYLTCTHSLSPQTQVTTESYSFSVCKSLVKMDQIWHYRCLSCYQGLRVIKI